MQLSGKTEKEQQQPKLVSQIQNVLVYMTEVIHAYKIKLPKVILIQKYIQ